MSTHFGHQIARRAGHVRDDRARRAGERVEQARLADVRLADDRDLQSFANQPAARAVREQRVGVARAARRSRRQRAGLDEVIALFRKIDRRLEPRDQIEQRRIDLARSRASACPPADRTPRAPAAASPRRSDRHRLRLRQIDAAVRETRAA